MTSTIFAFLRFKLALAAAVLLVCATPADQRREEKSRSPAALNSLEDRSATSGRQSDTPKLVASSLHASSESEQQSECRASDCKTAVSACAELHSGSAVLSVLAPAVEGESRYLVCGGAQNTESTSLSRRRWRERSARGPPRV